MRIPRSNRIGIKAIAWAASVIFCAPLIGGCWPQEEHDSQLPSENLTYYEMQVDLVYKPTGKDVHIRYQFACGVRHVTNLAREGSTRTGIYPRLYGEALPDGSGIAIQTPKICGSSIALDEMVPADFLPIILFAPDSQHPEFMVAHLSEDSFEQRASKLIFQKASIRRLNEQPDGKPILTSGFVPNDLLEIKKAFDPPFTCRAAMEIPIPETAKAAIENLWPEPHKDYWRISSADYSRTLQSVIIKQLVAKNRAYSDYFYNENYHDSISRKKGYGNLFLDFVGRKSKFGSLDVMPLSESVPEVNTNKEVYYELHRKDGLDKGFAFCAKQNATAYSTEETIKQVNSGIFQPTTNIILVDGKQVDTFELGKTNRNIVVESIVFKNEKLFKVVTHSFE